jgi:hypothetical protein
MKSTSVLAVIAHLLIGASATPQGKGEGGRGAKGSGTGDCSMAKPYGRIPTGCASLEILIGEETAFALAIHRTS